MKQTIYLVLLLCCWSCAQYGQLQPLAPLPKGLNEVSGMITFSGRSVWVIEDSSNPDKIREVDTLGKVVTSFEVSNAKNRDWEALTTDLEGHVYIGDFGNNNNKRKKLRIYKLPDPREEKGDKIPAKTISFAYPEQKAFPPPEDQMRFDAEAFFHHQGYLYIITKNRSKPFDGTADIYRVPDQPGSYQAKKLGSITLCKDRMHCQVTDAALSPDGEKLVLLGYGNLWILDPFAPLRMAGQTLVPISLGANTQLEAICFANDQLLYLADEKKAGTGGNLYSLPMPPSRTQPVKEDEDGSPGGKHENSQSRDPKEPDSLSVKKSQKAKPKPKENRKPSAP